MARPELLDRRPGWGGGKVNATTVLLEPLAPAETALLIESLRRLDEGLRERIREAAEGNPLFVEEMVAMVRESGDGEVGVPPTIQALLAARLDQLDAAERDVLQCGSVEGRGLPPGRACRPRPGRAARRRPADRARAQGARPSRHGRSSPGEDAFRFRHLLIRDTAYDALPKATRAELHERFADWLEQHGIQLVELRRDPRLPPGAGVIATDKSWARQRPKSRSSRCGRANGSSPPHTEPSAAVTCRRP